MKKTSSQNSLIFNVLVWLVFATLLVPLVFSSNSLYPFVAPKALFIRAAMALALPFYAYLLIANKQNRPSLKNPITLSLLAFLALGVISGIFGVNPGRSFWGNYERMDGMFQLLNLGLLYFYLLYLFKINGQYARKFLFGSVVVAFLTSAYSLLELTGIHFFTESSSGRVSSTFGNPIFFASFLIIPIFLAGFFALSEEVNWKRYFLWLALAVQILAVYFSQTRGAVVGLVIAGAALGFGYVLFNKNARVKKWGFGSLAVLILIFGGLFFYGLHASSGSAIGRVFNLYDSNTKSRLIQWQSGIKGFKDSPILGVGPENYYVIANKYFNPEIYKYDPTWFDKPHNYFLEILLTRGTVGLSAYLALLGFVFYALWKAKRAELLTDTEFYFLAAGFLSYQIQNIFAFDTTSAAWMFFAFVAFAAYLWQESKPLENLPEKKFLPANKTVAAAVFWVLAILCVYSVYLFDWTTIKVLYNLNIAYATGVNNPQKAANYYEQAENQTFIYDPGDLAVKYSEFAVAVGQGNAGSEDNNFLNQVLDSAASVTAQVTAKISNNPIYWFHLANDYDTKSILNKTGVDPRAQTAVSNAIALAPNRVEPKFFQVQIYGLQNNISAVVSESETIAQAVPFNAEAKWRLALAYKDAGRLNDAVREANEALAGGYQFQLVKEFEWLINYYADQQNYQEVAALYEQAVKISPENYQLYASLASTYAKLGEKDKAIQAAQKVEQLNPSSKASVDTFIQSQQ